MHELRQRISEYLEVVVIIGGLGHGLLKHITSFFPQLVKVLVVDSHEELRKIPVGDLSAEIKLFTLGRRETAVSVCQGTSNDVHEYLRRVGGMDARDGCGQGPGIGYAAAVKLIESHDFRRFLEDELVPDGRAATQGVLSSVDVTTCGSGNGGTWSGAAIGIIDAIAKVFRDLTGAVTRSNFLVAGALTHDRLGPRIRMNAASTLMRLAAYVTDPNRDPCEIRTLRLLELPATGRDDRLRQAFLSSMTQASRAQWLLFELQRESPNQAVTSFLGNVQIWEAAFAKLLDPLTDVAPPIGEAFSRRLIEIRDRQPDERELPQLELAGTKKPLAHASIEDVLEDAKVLPLDAALIRLTTPTHRYDVEALARFHATSAVAVSKLSVQWAVPAETLDGFDKRLQVQRQLAKLLMEERQRLESQESELAPPQARLKDRFVRLYRLLNPVGFHHLSAALSNNRSKRRRLLKCAHAIRHLADELSAVETELAAVRVAEQQVNREYEANSAKLNELIHRLTVIALKSRSPWPLVTPRPLEECFSLVWSGHSDDERFLHTLCGCVEVVTLDGLAAVTGSRAPTIDVIAARIAHGGCYLQPPIPWGGQLRADSGWLVHVLPPLDEVDPNRWTESGVE